MASGELITVSTLLAIDGEELRVLSAHLHEALDEPGFARVTTVATEDAPPEKLVNKPAELTMSYSDGSVTRSFFGFVVTAERGIDKDGKARLRLDIAPRLAKLGRRTDCRTFQKLTPQAIVEQVCAGLSVDIKWNAPAGTERLYMVQYRETDLDFVERLLAEEGLFYVVSHHDGKDTVLVHDEKIGPLPDVETANFAPASGHEVLDGRVRRMRRTRRVSSGKVSVRDWRFEETAKPIDALKESVDPATKALEVYVWPARVDALDGGAAKTAATTLAERLLQSIEAERDIVEGDVGGLQFYPGYTLNFAGHPVKYLNREHLLTAIDTHSNYDVYGSTGSRFSCRFRAIPLEESTYRPVRREVARPLPEMQNATTTGPSGEELNTNDKGQVKVQFPWDRLGKNDENSSLWIRTMQLPTGGSMMVARVGWEVGVRFRDGDLDRPMVFGRFFNGVNMPPYTLPDNKSRSSLQTNTTPGGGSTNEFRTDDTGGKEEFFMNASKDMSITVGNNTTESVGNNSSSSVGSNHSLSVNNSGHHKVGANQSLSVGANQSWHVQTFKVDDIGADHTKTVGAVRDMKIGGDHRLTIDGSSTFTIAGMRMDGIVGKVNETADGTYTNTVGAALVDITAGDRNITVSGASTETVTAVKIVASAGSVAVEVDGAMMQMVGGAILTKISGDRSDTAEGMYTEIAAGASIVKCDNLVMEATGMINLIMGASMLNITPASITILGLSVKLDGATVETAALILDN